MSTITNGASYRCIWWWDRHFSDDKENVRTEIVASKGLVSDTIYDMMCEMQTIAEAARPDDARWKNFMSIFDLSPHPGHEPTAQQWDRMRQIIEEERGLKGEVYFMVEQEKADGRIHRHLIELRIDLETGRAIPDNWDAPKCHAASRRICEEFGWERVISPFDKDRDPNTPRPERAPKRWESYRAMKSGLTIADITAEVTELHRLSDNGPDFKAALESNAYILARGDRKTGGEYTLMIIDPAGDEHSLARRLKGVTTKHLNEFMCGLDRAALPSIIQAKEQHQERKIAELEADRATVRDEIQWEQALERAAIEKEERERQFVEPEPEKEARAGEPKPSEPPPVEIHIDTDSPDPAGVETIYLALLDQAIRHPDRQFEIEALACAMPDDFLVELNETIAAVHEVQARKLSLSDIDRLITERTWLAWEHDAAEFNRITLRKENAPVLVFVALEQKHQQQQQQIEEIDCTIWTALLDQAIRQPDSLPEIQVLGWKMPGDFIIELNETIAAVHEVQARNLDMPDILGLITSVNRGHLQAELERIDDVLDAAAEREYLSRDPVREETAWLDAVATAAIEKERSQHEAQEARAGRQEAEQQPQTLPAPELGRTQGDIRLARVLSHGPQSFIEALREKDLLLSRVTPEDIARDLARLRGQWEERRLNPQSWMEHEGGYEALNPDLQESARRSFDAWKEKQRQRQKQQDAPPAFTPPEPTAEERQKQLEDYVRYVQRQWAQGPRSHLAKATGGLAVVTRYGSAFVLSERNTALEQTELQLYLKRINRDALPTIAEAEAEQRLRMAEKAAQRDQPLSKTAAEIRLAYALTSGPADFAQALNKNGLRPARATAEEIHAGEMSDKTCAGDVVILDRWGNVYELNQRTTGDSRENAQAFLAGIDANLLSVTAIRREQQERQQQPFRHEPELGATAGNIRLAYALTQGPGDFTQALAEHGLRPARVTAEEIQAGEVSEKTRAGDVVILDRRGNIYELNRRTTGDSRENAQAFLAGIDANLPSVTAIRREQELEAERPLNEIAANIRLAYNLSRSAQGFVRNLDELGLKLARASQDEADRSRTASAFSREIGRFAPEYYEGQYVVVTPRGHAYSLNQHTTGQDRAAIEKFMATLDHARIQDIETTQRQARNEWHWPVMGQQPERQPSATGLKMQDAPGTSPALHFQDAARSTTRDTPPPVIPSDLRGIAAEIWTAYNTRAIDREWQRENADGTKETVRDRIRITGGRDPLKFGQALDERGLILARATKEEAEQSRAIASYSKQWLEYDPVYREGEFVVIDRHREVWKLTEHTTGHSAKEVQAFLNKAEWKALPGIEAGRQAMNARTDERLAATRDRAAHWDAIRLKNATRKHGGRSNGRGAAVSGLARPLGITARVSGRAIGALGTLGKLADGFSLDALTPKEKYEAAKRDARNEREADSNADYAAYMAALAEQRRRDQQHQAEQRQNEPEPRPQRQR